MHKTKITTFVLFTLIFAGCANSGDDKTSSMEYQIDASDMYTVDSRDSSRVEILTEKEEKWLIHMREEEKLARDVYTTLGEKWGMRLFTNIARSEQTHTEAIQTLLKRYGVEDPVIKEDVGEFTLPEMKELYKSLTERGSENLLEAWLVGAKIEDLDIFDLDLALKETTKPDIRTVYANLQKGSRNHMRAFVKQINNQGSFYRPEYISEEVYKNIISSPQEKGQIK